MMNETISTEQAIDKVLFLQKLSCQRFKNSSAEERIAKLKSIEKFKSYIFMKTMHRRKVHASGVINQSMMT